MTLLAKERPTGLGLRSDFGIYLVGQTISNLGASFSILAVPVLVFQITRSPTQLAIANFAAFLPYPLFGLIIGAWVDRLDRKKLMIWTDVARALAIGSISVAFHFDILTIPWLLIAVFLMSLFSIAFDGAQFAAVPSLVRPEDLTAANGRMQAAYASARVLGPLLAGFTLTGLGVQDLFWMDALTFLASIATLLSIKRSFNLHMPSPARRRRIRADLWEGVRYVWANPVLRNLSVLIMLINLIASTVFAELVYYAEFRLFASQAQVGFLYGAGSIGVVGLSLAAARLRKRFRFGTLALGALVGHGVFIIVLAANDNYYLALPIWALAAGCAVLFNVNTATLRQQLVPNEMLGRVGTVAMVVAWSMLPIGPIVGSFAIVRSGHVEYIFAIIGALVILVTGVFWFSPLRHAERYVPDPEGPTDRRAPGAPADGDGVAVHEQRPATEGQPA
jgi:MFS family permease